MPLPHFFLIGAPKAGTTALHVALAAHPDVFMSPTKEPKHFLTDGPPPRGGGPGDARTFRQYVWRRDDYEALFAAAPAGALRGESTSLYLHDRYAAGRIRAAVPDAKLVALLRDPVDRAHSNYTHLWSAGLEPERDFLRACALEQERAAAGWGSFWRYLELGRYGEQLERLYSVFPREQVLVLRYRDLRDRPADTLDTVTGFLGLRTGLVTEVPAANVTTHTSDSLRNRALAGALRAATAVEHHLPQRYWQRIDSFLGRTLQSEQRQRAPLTADQRAALIPHFLDDIERLESLTGDDYGVWRSLTPQPYANQLSPQGPIGTHHNSIDNPLPDAPQ